MLHLAHHLAVGNDHHHAVAIGVVHRAGVFEIVDLLFAIGLTGDTEETNRTSILKIVLDVAVLGAVNLHHQLVERVVVTAPTAYGIPCIATLHFALQPHRLGLSAVGFFFGMVFYLEQQPLLAQHEYGVVGCSFILGHGSASILLCHPIRAMGAVLPNGHPIDHRRGIRDYCGVYRPIRRTSSPQR